MTFFILAYWFEGYIKEKRVGLVRVWEISENLIRLGHEVVAFIPNHKNLVEQAKFKVIKIPFLDKDIIRPLSFYVLLFFVSIFYIVRLRPDIIYMRIMNTFMPVILSKLFRIPLIIEVHGLPAPEYNKSSLSKIKIFLSDLIQRINFLFCDKIIPISKELELITNKRYRIPFEKMTVINSGSNISLFRPLDTKSCRELLKLQLDLYYVGFVGNFLRHQGISTLIEAAPFVLNEFPDTKFLIVGEGNMKKAWIQEAVDKGLIDCFIFTGYVRYDRVQFYINTMDVCVAPFLYSTSAASPVKVFDYLACGRPLIASDVYIRGILLDSGAVILVPPENPKELGQGIVRLLKDKEERDRLGRNGRRFVVERYSWELLAEKTVQACQEVLI